MKINPLMDAAYRALVNEAQRTPILLLHPNSRYRNILIAMLINDEDANSFYYALGKDDINLQSFIASLSHEMSSQHPTFGRHLNMLPSNVYDDFDEGIDLLTETFMLELSELSDESYMLILDEYDRSDAADDIHRFIEYIADYLPENCHLILNSRTLPRLSWVALVAKKRAALLLDDTLIQDNFYGSKRNDEYDLEVFALGPGIVHFKGEPIQSWEGHLPRLLFFFALDKPVVTRSEICAAFWPKLDIDQAVNVFHVTKRRLHKALGLDVLVHEDSHYRINPELHVHYDVLEFVEALMKGRNPDNPNSFDAWQEAVQLYQRPFLQGHTDSWIEHRRVAFRAGYLEALSNMAQAWVDKDRKELALKLYRQALDEDYQREDIHRSVMQLYHELGRQSEAIAHYQDLEKQLEKAGGVSDETVSFYQEIVS